MKILYQQGFIGPGEKLSKNMKYLKQYIKYSCNINTYIIIHIMSRLIQCGIATLTEVKSQTTEPITPDSLESV